MGIRMLIANSTVSLLRQKRRSVTTVVSLAWAVACFLLLMSSGSGFNAALRDAFFTVGQDLILMYGGQTSEQKGGMRAGRSIVLEIGDIDRIREAVPFVGAISPEIMETVTVVRGNVQKEYMVRAVEPEYARIRNIHMTSGRWINADDGRNARRVLVLGARVAEDLFGNRPEDGEDILINGVRFTAIGRMEAKVQIANYNRPDNECIFIPYDTLRLFLNPRYPSVVVWSPVAPEARDEAMRQVRAVLAGIHRFSPTDEKAVEMLAFNQFVSIIDGVTAAFTVLMFFIGSITLAIGAVGLANIMFTSVIERTQEIGIMKALGARRRIILHQFLLEALLIVLAGGVIGLLLACLAAASVDSLPAFGAMLGEELSKTHGRIYFHISMASVAVSLGILFLVGIIAGMLPAVRASRLDPVRALHYE
ncbi:MAG: ABC transporter permease [Acidobacteria bacterium]|nr:ABC transporter permease [Acidobacteriota bacterium]